MDIIQNSSLISLTHQSIKEPLTRPPMLSDLSTSNLLSRNSTIASLLRPLAHLCTSFVHVVRLDSLRLALVRFLESVLDGSPGPSISNWYERIALAASGITCCPRASSSLMTDVFPVPGAPVRTKKFGATCLSLQKESSKEESSLMRSIFFVFLFAQNNLSARNRWVSSMDVIRRPNTHNKLRCDFQIKWKLKSSRWVDIKKEMDWLIRKHPKTRVKEFKSTG